MFDFFERFDNSPVLSFFRPIIEFFSEGKHFNITYTIFHYLLALVNIILPFVILFSGIESGFFRRGPGRAFAFIIIWLVVVFACWVGLQFCWDRRKKVDTFESAEFKAIPFFSETLQTSGEWLGIMIGIIGAGGGLVALFFRQDYLLRSILNMVGLRSISYMIGDIGGGVLGIITGPIIGITIMMLSRFIAEQIRVFAAIANK